VSDVRSLGQQLVFIYNDGYIPIFGAKHPRTLGLPFREGWSEIWDDIRSFVERSLSGEATFSEDLHLVMERNGYPESGPTGSCARLDHTAGDGAVRGRADQILKRSSKAFRAPEARGLAAAGVDPVSRST